MLPLNLLFSYITRLVLLIFRLSFVSSVFFLLQLITPTPRQQVEEYYRDTGECVRALAAAAADGNSSYPGLACDSSAGEGGVSVMLGLDSCLAGHDNAFLYHNSSAYLRLPLTSTNGTATSTAAAAAVAAGSSAGVGAPIARLMRYTPELPPRPIQPPGGSDRTYIVFIAVGLAAFGFVMAALRALYHRKRQSLAYGRDGGGGGGLGGGGIGGGWRSGGLSGSSSLTGLGDFDVGGGYEGALFPADAYSSGGLSGSRHEIGPMEVPLLNQSDSPMREGAGGGGGGGGGRGRGRQHRPGPATGSSRRNRGGAEVGGGGGFRRGGGGSSGGSDLSPPPFSRILGTMGGGPAAAAAAPARRNKSAARSDGSSSSSSSRLGRGPGGRPRGEAGGDVALEQGPFGGGGASREGGSLKRDDEPEGDEVFC